MADSSRQSSREQLLPEDNASPEETAPDPLLEPISSEQAKIDLFQKPPGLGGKPVRFDSASSTLARKRAQQPFRIIDTSSDCAFSPDTDCSDLSPLDVMMTILYNCREPVLDVLDKFLNRKESYKISLRRIPCSEDFNVEIIRKGRRWYLELWDRKLSQSVDATDERYVEGPCLGMGYEEESCSDPDSKIGRTWYPSGIYGSLFDENALEVEKRKMSLCAVRLARYVMLSKPWETQAGTQHHVKVQFLRGDKRPENIKDFLFPLLVAYG